MIDAYVALAASLPEAEWNSLVDYVSKGIHPPAFVAAGSPPLAAQRAASERWAAILDGLHRVNEADYTFAEPVDPKIVERLEGLVVASAHVRFADGKRHEATTLLLDGLAMARRLRDDGAESQVCEAFVRDLAAIPLMECERVREAAQRLLVTSTPDARLILLRLHMRIAAYRWNFGKLPERLSEAAPHAETLDPATGKPFAFVRQGEGYRLTN